MQLFKRDKENGKHEKNGADKLPPALREEKDRLGARLLEAGFIDEKQLDEACEESAREGKRLGQVLIEKRMVTASEVVQVLTASLRGPAGEEVIHMEETKPDIRSAHGELVSAQGEPVEPQPSPEEVIDQPPQPQAPETKVHEGGLRQIISKLRLRAENAAEVVKPVSLTVTPPVRTALEIEETVSPEAIPEDEPTEVTYTVVIRNTRRATGRNITLDLRELPDWFQPSEIKVDGQTVDHPPGKTSPLEVGDIAAGGSKTVLILGIASPSGETSVEQS